MTDTPLTSTDPATLQHHGAPSPWLPRELGILGGGILVAGILPFILRFGFNDNVQALDQVSTTLLVSLGVIISHLLVNKLSRYPGEDPLSTVFPAVVSAFAIVLVLIAIGHLPYARSLLVTGFGVTIAWYSLVKIISRRLRKPRLALVPVGAAANLRNLKGVEWISLATPAQYASASAPDGIVVDLGSDLPPAWADFIVASATRGTAIYDSRRTEELMTGEVNLSHAANIGLSALLPQRGYLLFKTVVDTAVAILLLPFVLVVLAVAAIAIKLDSKGPVIYRQKRVGYRGRHFACYKLRSMRVGADQAGPSFTNSSDDRITRVGRVIRKYRIDELPQIFNILKGEMSWIGPRPEAVALANEYGRQIPFYAFRHAVKPGISGWAAIRQGNVGEIEAAKVKLQHDFFYIKNISLSLDAFIAAKAIWIILTGFGSR